MFVDGLSRSKAPARPANVSHSWMSFFFDATWECKLKNPRRMLAPRVWTFLVHVAHKQPSNCQQTSTEHIHVPGGIVLHMNYVYLVARFGFIPGERNPLCYSSLALLRAICGDRCQKRFKIMRAVRSPHSAEYSTKGMTNHLKVPREKKFKWGTARTYFHISFIKMWERSKRI